jgi:hypothetical protein
MHPRNDAKKVFEYPLNGLLPLRGTISKKRMRKPDMRDHNGEACLLVIKNGCRTGVTIGRATGIHSYVRDDETRQVAKAWAIYNYDKTSVFSDTGNSGSIIVDGLGRVGGILTGGTGLRESADVTYATPMWWLWDHIRKQSPHAHIDPTVGAMKTMSSVAHTP